MSLRIATKANQALTLPALLVASFVNEKKQKTEINLIYQDVDAFEDGSVTRLELDSGNAIAGEHVPRSIAEHYPDLRVAPEQIEDEWLSRASQLAPPDFKSIEKSLLELESHLVLRSHVVGYELSFADVAVWGTLRGNRAAYGYIKKNHLLSVGRWFQYVDDSNPWMVDAVETCQVQIKESKAVKAREGASYEIALPDTDKGVVTRFPPEPSGYLHIGHAKAALLNDYFAHEKYKGTLIVRFDDTNPSKEKMEFEDSIVEDLALMGITPDKTTHSSDYFDQLYDYCVEMIRQGRAYADDTDQTTMRDQRMNGVASERRDRSVDENLSMFEEMKNGSDLGRKHAIRAKISVDNPNKAMRDPVIYRCNPLPHHRTGSKWNVYPTYDFCCPIVDSIEGVTHALRTIEYRDRNPQYEWMLDALDLRKPHIWDFSRLNFIRTLLSKRKLTKFVEDGTVWGWDDPRFPTIRGVRRRGMTVPALREFILRQGPSRNIVNLDWTIFWATNKKYIDPVAPRHTVIMKDGAVEARVKGAREEAYTEDKPKHGKNASLGMKEVAYSPVIILDQEDAKTFQEDEEITLMNWGNAFVRKIIRGSSSDAVTNLELELHLQGDVKKTEKKVTWLSTIGGGGSGSGSDGEGGSQELIDVELVDFDYLITKDKLDEDDRVEDFLNPTTEFRTAGRADANVRYLKRGDIIQFERRGYFRVDRPYHHDEDDDESNGREKKKEKKKEVVVLFNIPTGKTK